MKKIGSPDNHTIFDVGANVGEYSKILRAHFPAAQIYAFEPHPKTFLKLSENAKSIDVHAVHTGLGGKKSILKLYDYAGNEGSTHASLDEKVFSDMYQKEYESFDVNINTVDDFCKENNIEKIYFLKIDVEGLEFQVLQGAQKMLNEKRIQYIQFEFNSNNAYSKTNMNDFIQYLKGYNLYRLLPDGWINISEEEYLLREIYAFQNIIAVKK